MACHRRRGVDRGTWLARFGSWRRGTVTGGLVPAPAVELDRLADERELLRRRAEELAVRWLHGYTNPSTRNGYAVDIGLSPALRAALPDGPRHPRPAPAWAWIPWALDHGLDPAGQLQREQAEAYAHILQDAPKKTRQRRWASLCAFYRYLRVGGHVTCDPGEMVNRRVMGLAGAAPPSTLALSAVQVRALYTAAAHQSRGRARTQAMLAVLAATGCRAAELVGLNLDDHRPQPEGHALLWLRGKGGKERWAVLPAPDAALVATYLETRGKVGGVLARVGDVSATPSQPLFATSTGRRMDVDNIPRMLRMLSRHPSAAKVMGSLAGKVTPHQLRHAYAVTAEAAGVPVSQIQRDLGHSSLSTTQGYLWVPSQVEKSAARVVSDIYHAGGAA
jgi:integrase/recombinase XerC